jgi:uncharacterized caspase-like protein
MKANMAKDEAGQDLAVILFSGHGAIIDDRFYLLPYGVDARTEADLKASAISANEFHDEVAELAKYGRVLVLLDACHSGAATGDGSALTSNADVLRSLISASNVTVLIDVLNYQRILARRRKMEPWSVHQSAARRTRRGWRKSQRPHLDERIDPLCNHPCCHFD